MLVVWVALSWTGARDGLVMEVWGVVGVEGGMGRGVGRGRGVASAHADPAMRGKGMLGVGAGIGSSAKCVKVFFVTDALSEALHFYFLPFCTPVAEIIMFLPSPLVEPSEKKSTLLASGSGWMWTWTCWRCGL